MLCIVAEMNSRPRAAGAAVLIPCHSGPAELLPEGVSANELLPVRELRNCVLLFRPS